MKTRSSASRTPRVVGLAISLAFLGAALFVFLNLESLVDWARLHNYEPPEAIAQLAQTTTMTPEATRLFYVYHPELNDKSTFNERCTTREQTIVLGCYVSNRGIYLYDVQDPRLQGVKQVTAAHEMLHVAYERLSASEKEKVDALLQEAYTQVTDERIRANIESYQAEGADVNNELHSILGTEVANLPPELEAYYQQYFTNRGQVVAYATSYAQEFSSRKKQVEQYDAQMAGLKIQIETNEDSLDRQASNLAAQRQQLDANLNAGNYGAYNAGVASYNAAVRQYNQLAQTTKAQIEQYNAIVAERNKIALEEQNLAEALDSRTDPQATR